MASHFCPACGALLTVVLAKIVAEDGAHWVECYVCPLKTYPRCPTGSK